MELNPSFVDTFCSPVDQHSIAVCLQGKYESGKKEGSILSKSISCIEGVHFAIASVGI